MIVGIALVLVAIYFFFYGIIVALKEFRAFCKRRSERTESENGAVSQISEKGTPTPANLESDEGASPPADN